MLALQAQQQLAALKQQNEQLQEQAQQQTSQPRGTGGSFLSHIFGGSSEHTATSPAAPPAPPYQPVNNPGYSAQGYPGGGYPPSPVAYPAQGYPAAPASGGMFGGVLRTSGIGDALADSMSNLGIPVLLAAWLIAAALRVAQGSATVALTTAAALMVPAVEAGAYSQVQLALIVLATAAGSVIASHVNDSGFWLVGRLMGLDVATTLKTWTVNQTLIAVIGLVLASAFYGVTLLF